jgi:hypothetical protein
MLRNELSIVEDERDREASKARNAERKVDELATALALMNQRIECLEQALANMGQTIEETRRASLIIAAGGQPPNRWTEDIFDQAA